MNASPQVSDAMQRYILIRILAAPVTLGNYAILGYVLGRGEGATGLALQIILNGSNIFLSIWMGLTLGWGLEGVAWGTVCGEATAFVIGMVFLGRRFAKGPPIERARLFDRAALFKMVYVSKDIMVRSFALLTAFAVMTRTGAQLGTLTLAANAILMNFFMVAGYFLDGFATAAEQLAGRSIGARYRPAFDRAVVLSLLWGVGLATAATCLFLVFGDQLINLMTISPQIRQAANEHLAWAALCAVTGVLAFQMDGVFIGATWTSDMRNIMLVSLGAFLAAVWLLVPVLGNTGLWLSLHFFVILRGISLAVILPRRARQAFAA